MNARLGPARLDLMPEPVFVRHLVQLRLGSRALALEGIAHDGAGPLLDEALVADVGLAAFLKARRELERGRRVMVLLARAISIFTASWPSGDLHGQWKLLVPGDHAVLS